MVGDGRYRHIINNNTVSFEPIVTSVEGRTQQIAYQKWMQLITRSTDLAPLSSLIHEPVSDADGRRTFHALLHMESFRGTDYEAAL